MPSRTKYGLLITTTLISLFFTSVLFSYAETINYIYDELNRLIRVDCRAGHCACPVGRHGGRPYVYTFLVGMAADPTRKEPYSAGTVAGPTGKEPYPVGTVPDPTDFL